MAMPVPCAPSPTACSPCSAPCSGPRRSTTRTAMPNPPPHNNRGGQSPQKTTCKLVGSPARAPPESFMGRSLGRDDNLSGTALAWPGRGLRSRQLRWVNAAGTSPAMTVWVRRMPPENSKGAALLRPLHELVKSWAPKTGSRFEGVTSRTKAAPSNPQYIQGPGTAPRSHETLDHLLSAVEQEPHFTAIREIRQGLSASAAARDHRSEERRVGKECVSTCRSRWSPDH